MWRWRQVNAYEIYFGLKYYWRWAGKHDGEGRLEDDHWNSGFSKWMYRILRWGRQIEPGVVKKIRSST